jgi:hypothetical protein
MSKELCKLKKTLKIDISDYIRYVNQPTHVCQKCGRVANSGKRLCHPVKMK